MSDQKLAADVDALVDKAKKYPGLLVIDFDETLYLRNSTEDFIDLSKPGWLAVMILTALDKAAPWRWTGGSRSRDTWRVWTVLLFFPWTFWLWKRQCRKTGKKAINPSLFTLIEQRSGPMVVSSLGFAALIRPVLLAIGCAEVPLVACRLLSPSDRTMGKSVRLANVYSEEAVVGAMVITDSSDDADLLEKCAEPHLIRWSEAKFERALQNSLHPIYYTTKIKRVSSSALRHLVSEDMLLWILISINTSNLNWLSPAAAILLFLSMWSVYEIGYLDNDYCAHKYEKDPVLSEQAKVFLSDRTRIIDFLVYNTISAIVCGAGGLLALGFNKILFNSITWSMVLVGILVYYGIYNRSDKISRIWLYAGLQFWRSCALFLLLPVSAVAAAAGYCYVVSRWIEYLLYRYVRRFGIEGWQDTQRHAIRLMLFVLFLLSIALAGQWQSLLSRPAAVLILWFVITGFSQIRQIVRSFTLVTGQ